MRDTLNMATPEPPGPAFPRPGWAQSPRPAAVEGGSAVLGGGPWPRKAQFPSSLLSKKVGWAWWSPGWPEALVLDTEAQESTQLWDASNLRGPLQAPTHLPAQ